MYINPVETSIPRAINLAEWDALVGYSVQNCDPARAILAPTKRVRLVEHMHGRPGGDAFFIELSLWFGMKPWQSRELWTDDGKRTTDEQAPSQQSHLKHAHPPTPGVAADIPPANS